MSVLSLKVFRGKSRFSIGPFHSTFSETINFNGNQLCFFLKKSRFLNPFFYSDATFNNGETFLKIISRNRRVIMYDLLNGKNGIPFKVPILFPILTIGKFSFILPDGKISFEIGRSLNHDGSMYGLIYFQGLTYKFFYKFREYESNDKMDMFPDGVPQNLSMESMMKVTFFALWINAYNASFQHS